MGLQPIKYARGSLQIVDQLQLPAKFVYVDIKTIEDGYNAIRLMKVRGAPAIAVVGALTLAVVLHGNSFNSFKDMYDFIHANLDYLVSARPTAVNISTAANDIKTYFEKVGKDEDAIEKVIVFIEQMMDADVTSNKAIGDNGCKHIIDLLKHDAISVLTHCNTGALATVGYGTALGVIRSLHASGSLKHVYCTETRPYNQGARLTAFELAYEGIDATLIVDSAVSIAMQHKHISAVVVGADRIATNGDTANKIGTYQIAILAKHHGIPFFVAAPMTTVCTQTKCGSEITIEVRNSREITHLGQVRVSAEGVECWNPAFDVTPAHLITGGIITEHGVFTPTKLKEKVELLKL